MQKAITISFDLQQLTQSGNNAFNFAEVAPLNELLDEGWIISELKFLSEDVINGKRPMLIILSDEELLDNLWPLDDDDEDDELYLQEFMDEEDDDED